MVDQCRRAASNTIMVPVALTSWVAIGSARERGTDGRAARWTTASVSVMTPSRSSALRMEPSTTFTEGEPARFSRDPVEKSSRATTWSTKLLCGEHPAQVGADESGTAGDDDLHCWCRAVTTVRLAVPGSGYGYRARTAARSRTMS